MPNPSLERDRYRQGVWLASPVGYAPRTFLMPGSTERFGKGTRYIPLYLYPGRD
jgi:hypothetical protein